MSRWRPLIGYESASSLRPGRSETTACLPQRKSDAVRSANGYLNNRASNAEARYEQALVDRESALTRAEKLEEDMFHVLNNARRRRREAAVDTSAGKLDRLSAEAHRQAASEDRQAAAR